MCGGIFISFMHVTNILKPKCGLRSVDMRLVMKLVDSVIGHISYSKHKTKTCLLKFSNTFGRSL